MPEVRDHFEYLKDLQPNELHERREEILNSAPNKDYTLLEDEPLAELFCIVRLLRKTASAPVSKAAKRKAPVALEDLA